MEKVNVTLNAVRHTPAVNLVTRDVNALIFPVINSRIRKKSAGAPASVNNPTVISIQMIGIIYILIMAHRIPRKFVWETKQ